MNDHKNSEIITAHKLAAGYKAVPAWENADFSIQEGEFIGLLGANGAGKTTLLKLILGLDQPLEGSLEVFGETPKRGNPRIGYVPQRRFVDNESRLEALEYVRLGVSGNRFGFSTPANAALERQQAAATLELVGASQFANRTLSGLSGGELQRIFLAQALVGKPELLLLDEPLANLDIRREVELIRLISKVMRAEKITVILIAHDINPLLPVVNRIMYIANGKIASGAPESVVTSKTLSALYEAPIEVLRDSKGRLAVLGVEEAQHHD